MCNGLVCYSDTAYSNISLQKQSQYIDDVNQLIGLAHQLGLLREFDNFFETSLPNVTKCSTWQDIQASHMTAEKTILKLEDVYGIISFLIIGTSVGLLIFLAEIFAPVAMKSRLEKTRMPRAETAW